MNHHIYDKADAWEEISQMAHTLGWHNDWTPETTWLAHIRSKMAWGHLQATLRQKEFEERMEVLRDQPWLNK
jgi:hypothetical protein